MLAAIGYGSMAELVDAAVPASIRQPDPLVLPAAATETEAVELLRAYADRNTVHTSMIGLGYYDTVTPPVVQRNVLENPAWYTAYTPYQPEISQGRLEALLNFQTMVADLTGLATANASMLDESTAAAEAMTLARRSGRSKSNRFVVDADALPQTIAVVETRARPLGIEVVVADLDRRPAAGRLLRCAPAVPRRQRRRSAIFEPLVDGRARARGNRRGRGGPAGADAAGPAG